MFSSPRSDFPWRPLASRGSTGHFNKRPSGAVRSQFPPGVSMESLTHRDAVMGLSVAFY